MVALQSAVQFFVDFLNLSILFSKVSEICAIKSNIQGGPN